MDMTKEAMEHIATEADARRVQEDLDTIESLKSTLQAKAPGVEIINLEEYNEHRDEYRGAMATHSVPDFVEYVEQFSKEGSKCFVSDEMYCKAILDNGTEEKPMHRRHKASLKLQRTALYKALTKITDKRLTQKEAAEFLEDYNAEIEAFVTNAEGEEKSVLGGVAAQALRKLTIETARSVTSEVGDFENSATAMERRAAANKEQITNRFEFQCEPFMGLDNRLFEVRVSMLTSSSVPEIIFRIVRHDKHEEEMVQEFKDLMIDKLSSSEAQVFIGEFSG